MALPLAAPTFVLYPEQNIAQAAADRLGNLKAELAPLLNEEEALKQILRESGLDVVEGREYRATISQGKEGASAASTLASPNTSMPHRYTRL